MKNLIFTLILIAFSATAFSQNLLDIYKKGTVKLVPDEKFAAGNDWDRVFETYYDTLYGKPMGNRKSLIVLPDGSVVVNHAYHNYYSKFSPQGKFQKEFKVINESGIPFKKTQPIEGIINSNTFFTGLDNMGNMLCFDFDGGYKKTLKLDYMAKQMIPLPNGKIAVVGWVIWKEQFRDFVALVDYNTNKEKIIWDHFTDRCAPDEHCKLFSYSYTFNERGMISINTMPYTGSLGLSARPQIASIDGKLLIACPTNGDLFVYDLNGNQVAKDKIEWAQNYISVEEQKEIQQKAIDKYKQMQGVEFASWVSPEENKKAIQTILQEMEADLSKIKDPVPVPVFSTMLQDSDGNILIFEYPKEKGANKFHVWVYKMDGMFIGESTFVCDDYDLEINPSKMVFHNGYIYGLQKLKNATGVPLQLVRFKLM
jgi:hypothetical protein